MTDHETAPFTVADLTATSVDRARLACLSACESALTGAPFDEGIHLTSDLQLAGSPAVARALNAAVRMARNRHPDLPSLWAAHIHAGA